MFQRTGKPDWWIRWTCPHGHEHMEKAGPKSVARQLYQRRKVQVKAEGFCLADAREARRREDALRFEAVAARYLEWSAIHRPRSQRFRASVLRQLCATFGTIPIPRITRGHVEAYLKQRATEVSPATVNHDRGILNHVFVMAERWGLVTHNPVATTDRLPDRSGNPRPLTLAEEKQLFAALPTRWHVWVTMALHTGLRLGELRTQRWEHVDLASGTLQVTQSKSGKREVLPLNDVAFAVLAGLPQASELGFPDIPVKLSHLFRHYARRAGLPEDIHFHSLRHTYVSRLAPHCGVPTLMALARHRSYQTTQRYLKIEDERLRDVVQVLSVPAAQEPH